MPVTSTWLMRSCQSMVEAVTLIALHCRPLQGGSARGCQVDHWPHQRHSWHAAIPSLRHQQARYTCHSRIANKAADASRIAVALNAAQCAHQDQRRTLVLDAVVVMLIWDGVIVKLPVLMNAALSSWSSARSVARSTGRTSVGVMGESSSSPWYAHV